MDGADVPCPYRKKFFKKDLLRTASFYKLLYKKE
ncbi:hypothetical protein H4V98_001319 [Polaromonas sp. CG_23.6]|nr:hypothetical protein [Polaromonas sp. CG_23.6]